MKFHGPVGKACVDLCPCSANARVANPCSMITCSLALRSALYCPQLLLGATWLIRDRKLQYLTCILFMFAWRHILEDSVDSDTGPQFTFNTVNLITVT
jgi:hypothetical protein